MKKTRDLVAHFYLALNKRDVDYFQEVYTALFEFFEDNQAFSLFAIIKSTLTAQELDWIRDYLQ